MQSSKVSGYVNAGGRGTRLSRIFSPDPKLGVTKALLTVGRPSITMIEHQINRFKFAGLSKVVVGVGDHKHVADYINDRYSDDLEVVPVSVQEQLGNGGNLLHALQAIPQCFGDHIIISNVDGLIDIDEQTVIKQHLRHDAEVTIVLTSKKGVPNENAYYVTNGRVIFSREVTTNALTEVQASSTSSYRGSSTGVLVIKRELLEEYPWSLSDGPLSLYREIVAFGLTRGKFYAYSNGDRFFIDVGTEKSWDYVKHHSEQFQNILRYRK